MPDSPQPVTTDASGRPLGTVGHGMVPLWENTGAHHDTAEPIFVDAGIVHLLRDLNRRGFTTEWSCQGDDPSRRGYISFNDLQALPAITDRLHELLSGQPELAKRFGWGPDPSSRTDDWSAHTHRRNGRWGCAVHLPAAWIAAMDEEVLKQSISSGLLPHEA
jgi:hypothetical protein